MKPVKKFFVYKYKISIALRSLAGMFIKKLKTKFNSFRFLLEWFQIQKEFVTPLEEISPQELNKCLQKFHLSANKAQRPFGHLRAKTVIDGSSKWVKNHHLCAQLSHCLSIY